MSMSTWDDPEEMVACPYDPVHRLRRKRMQYHLTKCRKNFVVNDYVTCPFNATHVIPKPEFEYHLFVCEDRGRFEAEQLRAQTQRNPNLKGNTSIPTFDPNWRPDHTESWDDDNVVYVPPVNSQLVSTNVPAPLPEPSLAPSHPPPPPFHPAPWQERNIEEESDPHPRLPHLGGTGPSHVFQHAIAGQSSMILPGGRGRGRGWSTPVTTETATVGSLRAADLHGNAAAGASESAHGVGGLQMEGVVGLQMEGMVGLQMEEKRKEEEEGRREELYKSRRKLQKMLRQIERLEEKGAGMSEDEATKVEKKGLIVEMLDQMKKAGLED